MAWGGGWDWYVVDEMGTLAEAEVKLSTFSWQAEPPALPKLTVLLTIEEGFDGLQNGACYDFAAGGGGVDSVVLDVAQVGGDDVG